MHSSLFENLPVLSLTPDSISSLGELDSSSLSEIWGLFTKVKDSIAEGRRLENLSWRLWFESGRREMKEQQEAGVGSGDDDAIPVVDAQELEWSDPEWTEATDSESEDDLSRPAPRRTSIERPPSPPSPEPLPPPDGSHAPSIAPSGRPVRPPISHVNTASSSERRPLSTRINGGTLQRMITGLTTTPLPTKARYPGGLPSPLLVARTSPSVGPHDSPSLMPVPDPLSPQPSRLRATLIDMPTQTTPSSSHRPSPVHSPPITRRASIAISSTLSPPAPSASVLPSPLEQRPPSALVRLPNGVPPRVTAAPLKPALTRRLTSVPGVVSDSDRLVKSGRTDTELLSRRTQSSVSFEPRSLIKGFDTTLFDNRPRQGSIAPPPTPPSRSPTQDSIPKSPPVSITKSAARPAGSKKMFFIPNHGSDSEDDLLSRSLVRASSSLLPKNASSSRRLSSSPLRVQATPPPPPSPGKNLAPSQPIASGTAERRLQSPDDTDDEWVGEDADDDDDDDDDDASSGWGSEYSTESDAPKGKGKGPGDSKSSKPRPQDLFAKRPSLTTHHSELRPRGPGLLSQLFHPGQFVDDDELSTSDMSKASGRALLQTSKSAGVLSEQLRSKSFLRGPPVGTEMESSSEEEEGEVKTVSRRLKVDSSKAVGPVATPLPRQNSRADMSVPIAPLQTPRTTRRAMLATELSESLRRNLLWERQTRNRVMGGPIHPRPPLLPTQSMRPPPSDRRRDLPPTSDLNQLPLPTDGLRAPHPSPDTRSNSPVGPMVRRHTTGTGLYLQAQTGYFNRSSDEDENHAQTPVVPVDLYQDSTEYAFHGW